jgi:hypothetical protein
MNGRCVRVRTGYTFHEALSCKSNFPTDSACATVRSPVGCRGRPSPRGQRLCRRGTWGGDNGMVWFRRSPRAGRSAHRWQQPLLPPPRHPATVVPLGPPPQDPRTLSPEKNASAHAPSPTPARRHPRCSRSAPASGCGASETGALSGVEPLELERWEGVRFDQQGPPGGGRCEGPKRGAGGGHRRGDVPPNGVSRRRMTTPTAGWDYIDGLIG